MGYKFQDELLKASEKFVQMLREEGISAEIIEDSFRDYLRTHPATAEAYARLKLRLAESLADPDTYPEVKDPAVDLIYLAAEEWARGSGWQPAPSDA